MSVSDGAGERCMVCTKNYDRAIITGLSDFLPLSPSPLAIVVAWPEVGSNNPGSGLEVSYNTWADIYQAIEIFTTYQIFIL